MVGSGRSVLVCESPSDVDDESLEPVVSLFDVSSSPEHAERLSTATIAAMVKIFIAGSFRYKLSRHFKLIADVGTILHARPSSSSGNDEEYVGPTELKPPKKPRGRVGESCQEKQSEADNILKLVSTGAFLSNSTGEFLLCAVANLDGDPELDVWSMTSRGQIVHQSNGCR